MGLLNSKSSTKRPREDKNDSGTNYAGVNVSSYRNVLVLCRRGSQFFDKDGDLAHEFYEEVRQPNGHVVMQRVTTDLKPQGIVTYDYPRLHPDCPHVLV